VVVPIAEVGLGKVFGALTEEVRFAQDFPLKTDSNLVHDKGDDEHAAGKQEPGHHS
jgi:hypothetical protein